MEQNRKSYPLAPPNSSMGSQTHASAAFDNSEGGSSNGQLQQNIDPAASSQNDRKEDPRQMMPDPSRGPSNGSFYQANLPSINAIAQSSNSTSPAPPGPQYHHHQQQQPLPQQQPQGQSQSSYPRDHSGLSVLSQHVPRREIDALSSRRESSQGPSAFHPANHRPDHLASHEGSRHDHSAKMDAVQAAQKMADPSGYRPLNVKDALSYLDQVKIQFYDSPDVYNKFLDIMKDFKSQSIDTPGVIERVSTLFRGHPALVQGFNTFLPPGYRIECSLDPHDPNPIRVTTPAGTVKQVNGNSGGPTQFSAPVPHSQSPWRNDDQFDQRNAAFGMTAFSQGGNQQQQNGASGDKKPVEFNHAINYVNKIKTRFSNDPDTYKHFLEILQTYQKDQKPIHEVYSQVTELFKGAQDLLSDFKQFLPENNASGSAAARMPTVGTFAPPAAQNVPASNGRDRKRKPVEPTRPVVAKKSKVVHRPAVDAGPVSPTLLPAAPEPLTPQAARAFSNVEEIAFFDRAKKHINNKPAAIEFYKVLNLYTQEIIDKNTLVDKIDGFLGSSRDLMDQFKKMVQYTGADEVFENLPATTRPKIDLSLCKAFGPSYRKLPQSETRLPCSGRDDMCWEVLNDMFVSHPTWASEDAGFFTHKKNQYEEALHKIEEERYEYDLNIEANLRTIQLLEPIAQRVSSMVDEEKRHFKLPPGLGGQSIAIYQKVIKKIYEKVRGQEIIDQLHENPVIAVPVVLKRLKQKDEEWKRAQREWNKVWRETEVKNYYKSLDHQGTYFKAVDKKAMTSRNMITEIETLRKVQDEQRINPRTPKPQYQYEYSLARHDICLDVQRLIDAQINRFSVSSSEKEKMTQFNQNFLPLFFGITSETLVSSAGGDADDIAAIKAFSSGVITRRKRAGESLDLLKSVMKRTRESAHNRKKAKAGLLDGDEVESAAPSRASTPMLDDRTSDAESSVPEVDDKASADEEIKAPASEDTMVWAEVSQDPAAKVTGEIAQPVTQTTSDERHLYNLFSSSSFYTFLRWFQMLYERLHNLKMLEAEVASELKSRKPNSTAVELGLVAPRLASMSEETSDDTDHYEQLLLLCENFITQTLDSSGFEDMLRHIYGTKAFKLYTVDKITLLIAKQIHALVTEDKNIQQTQAFYKDRNRTSTTPREQVIYRIQTETIIGPTEQVYRSEWNNENRKLRIQLIDRDDAGNPAAGSREEAWRQYLASWTIAKPTFGVPQENCRPCLLRNLPRDSENEVETAQAERWIQSRLELKVCMNTYKLFFVKGTEDVLVRRTPIEWPENSKRQDKFEGWLKEHVPTDTQDVFDPPAPPRDENEDAEMADA